MKLQIPFVSQQNNTARNDCGAACVAMCAGVSTNQVLAAIDQPDNQPLHIQAVAAALRHYGLPNDHVRPLALPTLRELLANGWPVIALVRYGRLPNALKADKDFDDNHFVVVTGFTVDSFFVHDPLWPTAELGAHIEWPDVVMGEALRFVAALPMQGVVVQQVRPILEPELSELGQALTAVRARATAVHYLETLYEALGVPPAPPDTRQGLALAAIVRLKREIKSPAD